LLAGLIGVPALVYGEAWRVKWASWLVVNSVWSAIVLYLLWLLLTQKPPDFLGLPRVIAYRKDLGVLIVQGSPWLSMNVGASVYAVQKGVEILVCAGEVQNVQTNKLVQIRLSADPRSSMSQEKLIEFLDQADVSGLLVKPALFQGMYDG
jgi:hypothetical protein